MHEKVLDLDFKGARDYLQGPDIYNQTLKWLEAVRPTLTDIDFAFHRRASRQLGVIFGPLPEGVEPVAVCAFTSEGKRERIYLVETDSIVTGRKPYPEEEIVSELELDFTARCGVLRGEVSYTDIEVWVAMTKALHYKVFPHLDGKWLFVRGRFPQYRRKTKADMRSLVIVSSFNDKLTRSEALLDGVKVGEIFFSIV